MTTRILSTETLKKRMCVKCNLKFAVINMKETHQKWCTKKPRQTDDITWVIEESEASASIEAASSSRPIRPRRIKAPRELEPHQKPTQLVWCCWSWYCWTRHDSKVECWAWHSISWGSEPHLDHRWLIDSVFLSYAYTSNLNTNMEVHNVGII